MLENLYSIEWLSKRSVFALLMGFTYSILGMASALFLFPEDPGLIAVAFTSILILPTLRKLLHKEHENIVKDKIFRLKSMFSIHKSLFAIYCFLFLGVFLAFGIFTVMLPKVAGNRLFATQIAILGFNATGQAFALSGFLKNILANNFKILLLCFLTSFVYGSGAIVLITWNASVWGSIFGMLARDSLSGSNPFLLFFLTFIAVAPHMLAEVASYIIAAMGGGMASRAVLKEKIGSVKFNKIITHTVVLVVIAVAIFLAAGLIEAYVAPVLKGTFKV